MRVVEQAERTKRLAGLLAFDSVELVTPDARRGLLESLVYNLSEAHWQRCVVHFFRNVFSYVLERSCPQSMTRDVAKMLEAIQPQENRGAGRNAARAVIDEFPRLRLQRATELAEGRVGESITYNTFPNGQSCPNPATARHRYVDGTQ